MKQTLQTHPFDSTTKLAWEGDHFRGQTSEAYANMIGPYGGWTAAVLLRAAMEHPDCLTEAEPISLTVNYAAAPSDGEFIIKAIPARTNRSTQFWTIELLQDDNSIITGTAVFAKRRETWSSRELEFPKVPAMKDTIVPPRDKKPKWLENYDLRIVSGFPYQEGDVDTETIQWVKDEPSRQLDFLSLTSLSDAFYPRIFAHSKEPVPAGTVSLTIYFHADGDLLQSLGESEVLGHARAVQFQNGFFDQTAEMWSPDGKLLATTTQIVYFKG